jgi:hypothetical protein
MHTFWCTESRQSGVAILNHKPKIYTTSLVLQLLFSLYHHLTSLPSPHDHQSNSFSPIWFTCLLSIFPGFRLLSSNIVFLPCQLTITTNPAPAIVAIDIANRSHDEQPLERLPVQRLRYLPGLLSQLPANGCAAPSLSKPYS